MRFNADIIDGKIDSDFRGEVGVIIKNNDVLDFCLHEGTRIAQMIFQRYLAPELTEVEQLDETERTGGFGSTGTK